MSYATIDDLRSQLGAPSQKPAYAAKMLHDLPTPVTVDRAGFILDVCKGKHVLEFGASGKLHAELVKVAAVLGVDREPSDGIVGLDLDDVTLPLPDAQPDVIVCGEILEHLSNPGHFLQRVRQYRVPVIISVPNAFSRIQQKHIERGRENVNVDHVAWYSPKTLQTLVERYGFRITQFAYYNGEGPTAEGLLVVVE